MKRYKVGEFAKLLNVTVKTLQNWDKQGTLKAYRTPTNQRFYTEEQLNQILNLSIKLAEKGIKETIVNPAYTSQVCCKCNHLGSRNGKVFKCLNCNLNIDADFNASINTKKRKFISEINIDTPYKEVKKYYENISV